jgi:hypothetical protein
MANAVNLTLKRGKELTFVVALTKTENGVTIALDLAGAVVRFTAKSNLRLDDTAALIAKSSAQTGDVSILEPASAGRVQIRIAAADTNVPAIPRGRVTTLFWDAQATFGSSGPHNPVNGLLTIEPAVTTAT